MNIIVNTSKELDSFDISYKGDCDACGEVYSISFPQIILVRLLRKEIKEIEDNLEEMIQHLNKTHIKEIHFQDISKDIKTKLPSKQFFKLLTC